MIKYFFTKQFLLFLIAGSLAAILHWAARLILSIWLPFIWAVAFAYLWGIIIGFMLNSFLVFPLSLKARHIQARDFILVNLFFLPLVWSASVQINELLKVYGVITHSEEIAHALAIPLPMLATFIIYKFFAFKEFKNNEEYE